MNLAEKAFQSLYPNKIPPLLSIKFSGHFKEYNGNVSIRKEGRKIISLEFKLSKKFKELEKETKIGIIHHLLNKVYKTSIKSMEQDIYHNFIKHLTRFAERQESDPLLVELYHELNEEYFNGLLDQPNIIFGNHTTTTLGHYQYAQDLVTISTALKSDREIMKYVLYHELLHKKHSFKVSKSGRNNYHTKVFKEDEAKFHNKNIEKKLQRFLLKKKIKKALFW